MDLSQIITNETSDSNIELPSYPHLACVILLDTSSSMDCDVLDNLNRVIKDIKAHEKTATQKVIDIAIIEFNVHARVVQDFTPLSRMEPVTLSATGCTAMGEGINLAIDKVKERNRFYNSTGTPCFKPWIFMITDGAPTDDIEPARQRILDEESGSHGKLKFWAIGVPGYSKDILTSLTKRCFELIDNDYYSMFYWLFETFLGTLFMPFQLKGDDMFLPNNIKPIINDWE